MVTCVVDTKIISGLIGGVIGKDKWNVKRIYNNEDLYDRAICILKYKDNWMRIEYLKKDSGKLFLYTMNSLGFIDYTLILDFNNNKEVIDFCNSLL